MHGTHHEYSKLGISFRLPIEEDPMAFHDCIRAAGLVTGQFEVMAPPTDRRLFLGAGPRKAAPKRIESQVL